MAPMTNGWNEYWKKESNLEFWAEPDKAVTELLGKIDHSKISKVLDFGCGIGRHSFLFAKAGFSVTALDSSEEALNILRQRMQEQGIHLKITHGTYAASLFPRNYYDLVIAFNVIYHGQRKDMVTAIATIHYWLKPGGMFFFTCPTRRDGKFGNGEKVAPNTFRPLNSIHPGDLHYFADENDIIDFLRGFALKEKRIEERIWNNNGVKQQDSFYQILAVKQ
jgi:2-polyprenyl-3-methyl-5-hydroxy-6-metoxy-1,4-benzoquinol methylase